MGGQGWRPRSAESDAGNAIGSVEASASASGTADAQSMFGNASLLEWLGFGPEPEKLEGGAMAEVARKMDEQLARQELAGMFETGDVPVEGKAWVSPEEFDHVVAMYSAIRRGETQLTVDGDDEFRAGAMKDIAKIMQTQSGRDMLYEIANGEHTTRIGGAADPNSPATRSALPGVGYDREGLEKLEKAATDGKSGVDSEIGYAPGHTVKTPDDGEIASDVTLYHELVHAWHNGRGDNYPGRYNGIDNDEYQAVWFDEYNENRYREERAIDLGEDVPDRETYGGKQRPPVP